jgi:sulfate/thiosulfate transport system ATP-binding protein
MSIDAHGIRKKFGAFTALDGVDLHVPQGKLVAVLGPSGSGKTTLLRIIAGLEFPDPGSGRILFHGDDVTDVPAGKRRVGFVFQHYALFRHMSVIENVAFGLRVRRRRDRPPSATISERAHRLLELVQLDGLAGRFPSQLSGGQRQRVALGRALATDPALLLLDEPLSALDLPLRQALQDELRTILTGWGIAAVLVTHDLTEAYRLGDRIVVYEEGRVIQAAPRAELLSQPSSRSVARIMGIRNLVQGVTLKATADRIQFRWRGQVLEAVNSPTHSYLPAPDSPLAFFIRPEYVRLIRKDRTGVDGSHHMNLMAGTVVREVDLGASWTLFIRLDESGTPAQGDYDLELEVPRLVYEILEIDRDRHWQFSLHRGAIHVLPSA